ncbi:hypothetical protein BV22DRAFT_1079400 [Leucogyrophana mollusca]|uniref:Uncharacterized protein n=2 Tax=Leucogyrophana mollusca TaxID=85980 RepID=A0ACB8BXK5_9AGAM|nr:hypothetical protein BV22DRAFT_1079400 [Leucogyrophana mollusca]
MMKGPWLGRNLRVWAKAYIGDRTKLPTHRFGKSHLSRIDDEALATDIKDHLQSLGKFVRAQDIVDYLSRQDVQKVHGFRKPISLSTAQRWMNKLGYRWKKEPKGQYSDGHEREDVVTYRQKIFLPAWREIQSRLRHWKEDNVTVEDIGAHTPGRRVVVWFHDESTFYANDRRKLRWVHASEGAVPQPKGEGASIMVAHFVSADYGWMESPDGKETARILFKAGKARDGYYTSDDILKHAAKAMDILEKHYPDEDHILVFDNATTHIKRADNALSARNMPKKSMPTWGINVTMKDTNGKPIIGENGKPRKERVPMAPGRLHDGTPQPLYIPEGEENAGWFKGMARILKERGYDNAPNLPAECQGFKCLPGAKCCCCRRLLYNEPDFANVESVLEAACRKRGFRVIFLPKFHCELNFIEQCWGFAKRVYRQLPPSSKEADLERNVLDALRAVPLQTMRKFAIRSRRFIDAYQKGLNGKQAAWAVKKYRGHRVLPDSILCDFDEVEPIFLSS